MRDRSDRAGARAPVGGIWIGLSLAAAACAEVASAAALIVPSTYARETELWAAQGEGQDAVNLVVVIPALVLCGWFARAGSLTAALVWLGLLLWKRDPRGALAAVPLAVFTIAMAAAISGMAMAVGMRGLGSPGVAAPMALLAALTGGLVYRLARTAE